MLSLKEVYDLGWAKAYLGMQRCFNSSPQLLVQLCATDLESQNQPQSCSLTSFAQTRFGDGVVLSWAIH